MRDSFIFYKSFYEAIKELSTEQQAMVVLAVMQYQFDGIEPDLEGVVKAIFILIKPQLDANNTKYINGCKGGAPKGNSNAKNNRKTTEKQPKNNLKTTEKQPNENENDNVNENVNENENDNENEKEKERVSNDTLKKKSPARNEEFVDVYARECFMLPQVKCVTDSRKKAIKAFLTKYTLSDWEEVCKIASTSDFLCGKNDRGWKADFDFLIKINKATSVLEGKYSGKPREGPEEETSNPFLRVLKEMEEDDQKGSSADTNDNENDVSTILSDYTVE